MSERITADNLDEVIKRNEVIEEQMKQSASLIWSKYNPMQINSPIQLALQILRPYGLIQLPIDNHYLSGAIFVRDGKRIVSMFLHISDCPCHLLQIGNLDFLCIRAALLRFYTGLQINHKAQIGLNEQNGQRIICRQMRIVPFFVPRIFCKNAEKHLLQELFRTLTNFCFHSFGGFLVPKTI